MRAIFKLLQEDGNRWMTEHEQFVAMPTIRDLRPYQNRPVWLVLSITMRECGFSFRNGLGVTQQMVNMKEAWRRGPVLPRR